MADNVRVAVRVRPFNSREKARNAVLIIKMQGNSTYIKDPSTPDQEPRKFAFDYSYWSHDGFKERDNGYLEPVEPQYADQKKVFDDLGRGVLENAWKGYNCSLFAYGQTGSGKSYSMVGYGENKGIIPIFCEELFSEIEVKRGQSTETEYQVTFSMLEIYNEQVRDLLNPASNKKGGLKVRQHPSKGFVVESLVTVPVKDYNDIENRIEEGTRNRTVAATNMNATSSRAHTIVAITFAQKGKNEAGQMMTKTSIVNLVDLAGSERADSTGATGDRLKEGSAINQSLSTLGNCIKALADLSMGKKGALVPFRDSVLTKLLKNALGGNSKTIMIAALSPADINFDETLSTLRFADRAKSIKTKAVVNESPTEKLIRELREENQKLMEQLKMAGQPIIVPGEPGQPQMVGVSEEEVNEMKKEMEQQLLQNQREMEEMKKSWQERLAEQEAANKAKEEQERKEKEMLKTTPHFWNLNEDSQLSRKVIHFIKPGKTKIGNKKADPLPEIVLSGLGILTDHATVTHKSNTITILAHPDAKLMVNGKPARDETEIHHNDRVVFGSSSLFVLHHPVELDLKKKQGVQLEEISYDLAQEEIAANSGFDMGKGSGQTKNDMLLQEDLVQMVPMISETNAMAEELDKKVKFEILLISPQARGLKEGRTEVKVKMKSLEDDAEWIWDRNKFLNRKFLMQEMYQNYVEGEDWDLPQERDPFWEPDDAEVLIGSAHVYLQSLAYKIEVEESLTITDHKGNEQGHLQIEAYPCDDKGNEDGDDFVEDPKELIGQSLYFKLKIPHARGLPARFGKGETHCKFKLYLDHEYSVTGRVSGTINPSYAYEKKYSFNPVTKQFVDYLLQTPLVVEVWGKQSGRKISRKETGGGKNNPVPLQRNSVGHEVKNSMSNGSIMSKDEAQNMKLELHKSQKRSERFEKKLKKMRGLVEDAKNKGISTIQIDAIEDILNGGEGDKFKATADIVLHTQKSVDKDGKISSAACSVQ
ncbi:kinesin-like protein KIF28P [Porites lutea]|uniref:kinesin-like protein KIF28P n=1 Tax=Porites lutea TaxID=51062 RepID=UPI003CC5D407